jgi:beta-phosphoglucomutase
VIRAVLFDFDGVIGDTMSWHLAAWKEVLGTVGIDLKPEMVLKNEGRPAAEIAMIIARTVGVPLSPEKAEEVARRKNERFRAIHRASAAPGALELVAELKRRGVKVALVTGTERANVTAVLPAELVDMFDVIVAAGDAERGKPYPDPYLLAAQRMGVPPSRCLVVENAPSGIRAARAAGMACVALRTTLDDEYFAGADVVLADLRALHAHLDKLGIGKRSARKMA